MDRPKDQILAAQAPSQKGATMDLAYIDEMLGYQIDDEIRENWISGKNLENLVNTYRMDVRFFTEFQINCVFHSLEIFDVGSLAINSLVALLLRSWDVINLKDATAQGGGSGAISLRGLARSFQKPYESIRRAVTRLQALDLVVVDKYGVSLNPEIRSHPKIVHFLQLMHDQMVGLLDDLFVLGRHPGPEVAQAPWRHEDITFAALKLQLDGAEGYLRYFADWTDLVLLAAVRAGNVRHIAYDVNLTHRYAAVDQIPPQAELIPVSKRALAEGLKISGPTLWRYVTKLKLLGLVIEEQGGLIVPNRLMNGSRFTETGFGRILHMRRTIAALAGKGVPVGMAAGLYLDKRPPILTLQHSSPGWGCQSNGDLSPVERKGPYPAAAHAMRDFHSSKAAERRAL